uniref:UBC core domain-containing protein n=1 Tax=Salix viminalis TaxID=40686 RepID=A0A6N2LKB7_SALVM
MIRLFKVKEKQRELAENANGGVPIKKQSAGELRLHKDISELNLPKSCTMTFPNGKDDLMSFEVSIRPDEGYYLGGTFLFSFQVSPIYPHEAPKVKCKTKVYHPNIDLEGNVCLNILREDWKPVLNINTIIYGLYHLFTEPNYEDPLNHDAAAVLRDNPKMFESNVRRAMTGGIDKNPRMAPRELTLLSAVLKFCMIGKSILVFHCHILLWKYFSPVHCRTGSPEKANSHCLWFKSSMYSAIGLSYAPENRWWTKLGFQGGNIVVFSNWWTVDNTHQSNSYLDFNMGIVVWGNNNHGRNNNASIWTLVSPRASLDLVFSNSK